MIAIFFFLSFEKGVSYFEKKMFTRAKKEFMKFVMASKQDPRLPLTLYYLARLSKDPDSSLLYLKRIYKEFPGSTYHDDALLYMEKLYYATGRYGEAISIFNTLKKQHPSSVYMDEALVWAIFSLKRMGKVDSSRTLERVLYKKYPASRWIPFIKKRAGSPAPSSYKYTIQIGAFSRRENAEKLQRELKDKGISAFIVYSNNYYKVRTGKFSDYTSAKKYLEELKKKGLSGIIVKQ